MILAITIGFKIERFESIGLPQFKMKLPPDFSERLLSLGNGSKHKAD